LNLPLFPALAVLLPLVLQQFRVLLTMVAPVRRDANERSRREEEAAAMEGETISKTLLGCHFFCEFCPSLLNGYVVRGRFPSLC